MKKNSLKLKSFLIPFIIFSIVVNFLLPANLVLIERLVIFSVLLSVLYIWITVLWKKNQIYIYFFLLFGTIWIEPNLVFLFLNLMTIVFLVLIIFYTENKIFYINMIILNIFFLSISFLIFKFILLQECIALTDFLYFDLNCDTSQIAVEISLTNSYNPYPDNQYRIFLSKTGFDEQIRFLTKDFFDFPVEMVFYLYWLCLFTNYLPFIDITLVVY